MVSIAARATCSVLFLLVFVTLLRAVFRVGCQSYYWLSNQVDMNSVIRDHLRACWQQLVWQYYECEPWYDAQGIKEEKKVVGNKKNKQTRIVLLYTKVEMRRTATIIWLIDSSTSSVADVAMATLYSPPSILGIPSGGHDAAKITPFSLLNTGPIIISYVQGCWLVNCGIHH